MTKRRRVHASNHATVKARAIEVKPAPSACPDTSTMTFAPADPGANEATHACARCGTTISDRYPFPDCTRCAIEANKQNPEVLAWREQQRASARDRIAAMKAKQDEGR